MRAVPSFSLTDYYEQNTVIIISDKCTVHSLYSKYVSFHIFPDSTPRVIIADKEAAITQSTSDENKNSRAERSDIIDKPANKEQKSFRSLIRRKVIVLSRETSKKWRLHIFL